MLPLIRSRQATVAILIAVLGLTSVRASVRAADPVWEPEKTWVIAVGVLEWKDAKSFSSFPQKERRDVELIELFKKRGVPEDHIAFLKDKDATLERIHKTLADVLPQCDKDDLLILYYAGHGCKLDSGATCFANYDATGDLTKTAWSIPSIFDAIEAKFKGSRAWLMADACHSGGLLVEAKKRKTDISYACLTSAHANSTSTGNWTFTECLLAALHGNPMLDLNGDGTVTLEELAKFAQADMAFYEQQMSSFGVTGKFSARLDLAEAGERAGADVGKRCEVLSKGKWYKARVEEVKDEQFKIHYIGYPHSNDELVDADRIRVPAEPKLLPKATEVEVEWNGKWWPAKVRDGRLGLQLIHYEDFSDDWDEWVAPKRVRER